ncbi:hypothetical protein [Amycolatopsis eburnea]|uniref:Uncharacterized protein n=1 Tax=Amycolatopsis eburnea TaxID=2267691 RepID=A0A427T475_9PSEU|nr:hypothetical protein [Amycolatopsis eburnea]RSD13748.1 hypothetical protein EIY87_29080 [Amycolatopsis eburnea]
MTSTDPGLPVENTVRALRRLAPGAELREPRNPDLRALARALRSRSPAELARAYPGAVARVVLAGQLSALGRAMTGVYGPDGRCPEAARLVRAARYSRGRGRLLDRLRREPGLRAAALGWAGASGCRLLVDELLGVPLVPGPEDGRRAAELVVAAVVPRLDPGLGWPAESIGPKPNRDAVLQVRSLHLGRLGFRVDIEADPPVDLSLDDDGLTLRALWWNGLGRVTDDLGHEYLLLAKDAAGTGVVRHWCHPRPAPAASVLRLESAGYRGELLRLAPTAARACADVLVKLELTVRLGA